MSAPRLHGLSTRVSDDVYTALFDQAKAEEITLSSFIAQVLGEAVGETEKPDDDSRIVQPETDGNPEGEHAVGSGEEMIPRWQYELELWKGGMEARQSRLEEAFGNLERKLVETVERGKAAEQRAVGSLAPFADRLRKAEEGLAAAAASLNGLKHLSEPESRDRFGKLCAVFPDLCRLLEERRAGKEEQKEPKPRDAPPFHIGAS